MIDTIHHNSAAKTCMAENPAKWGPPEAPLYMPVQNLTPAPLRFKLAAQLRQLFVELRNGPRREI